MKSPRIHNWHLRASSLAESHYISAPLQRHTGLIQAVPIGISMAPMWVVLNGIMDREHRPAEKRFQVEVKKVQAPDGHKRLRRAFDLILRAAAWAEEEPSEENTPAQDSEQEEADGGR
ncbi:hypothetical protein ACFLX9_01505 [Chloroflexota bacterium]